MKIIILSKLTKDMSWDILQEDEQNFFFYIINVIVKNTILSK